jgi:hypothetical protein
MYLSTRYIATLNLDHDPNIYIKTPNLDRNHINPLVCTGMLPGSGSAMRDTVCHPKNNDKVDMGGDELG